MAKNQIDHITITSQTQGCIGVQISDHMLVVNKLCLKPRMIVKDSARRTLDLDKIKIH